MSLLLPTLHPPGLRLKRMTSWMLLALLILSVLGKNKEQSECATGASEPPQPPVQDAEFCMNETQNILEDATASLDARLSAVERLEEFISCTQAQGKESIKKGNLVAQFYKPPGQFKGLRFKAKKSHGNAGSGYPWSTSAEDNSPTSDSDSLVELDLPSEILQENERNTIVFCMLNSFTYSENREVADGRLYGLSICGKKISGLQQHVKITVDLSTPTENKEPLCRFLNFTNKDFSSDGCTTEWRKTEGKVICSCNHLTYFAVLMVSPNISSVDAVNLSLISVIGSSISLIFLLLTVLLFLIHTHLLKRLTDSDMSMKIHINLAIALILLNVHFLPSPWVASLAPSGACVYIAIMLHYSLLATFCWMGIEGFHLYLLLVRVFNIYVRRYLLKLGLLGWGVPAVVVAIVLAVDKDVYGLITVIPSGDSNSTLKMCYISSDEVKLATTVGMFALVFVCNLAVLGVTVRLLLQLRPSGAPSGERSRRRRVCRDACSVLAISCMLGVTWGLVLLSFSRLTLAGIYIFCILNSFQGFFISIWICVSRFSQSSQSQTSTETHSRT